MNFIDRPKKLDCLLLFIYKSIFYPTLFGTSSMESDSYNNGIISSCFVLKCYKKLFKKNHYCTICYFQRKYKSCKCCINYVQFCYHIYYLFIPLSNILIIQIITMQEQENLIDEDNCHCVVCPSVVSVVFG